MGAGAATSSAHELAWLWTYPKWVSPQRASWNLTEVVVVVVGMGHPVHARPTGSAPTATAGTSAPTRIRRTSLSVREFHARRFDRRRFLTAATAVPLLSFPFTQPGTAQTPVAVDDGRWESWADEITMAPSGPLRWRALLLKAKPLNETEFVNRPLGFVWNDDGRTTLIVENETRGSIRELDSQVGQRAVSFNHDQDSEARGIGDDEDQPWPYRYFNFDLIPADTYMSSRGDGEVWGWSNPFTASGPELRLSFGSLTIGSREVATYAAKDPANPHPVFAMCLEGRVSPLDEDWKPGLDLEPGDFVELSPASSVVRLYGRGINNVLVGLHSPDAGEIHVESLAS